jgi:hypothetical protein
MRIGIDLDNTLIDYESVFHALAHRRGLIEHGFTGGRDAIRGLARATPDGDVEWQRLQGAVYGKGIRDAVLYDGAGAFLRRARALGCEIAIVSHKTEFATYDPDRVNLREAAIAWLERQGFFRADGFAIPAENLTFAATRAEKIARIRDLGVGFFIDDLPEVLEDPDFPSAVTGILFTRGRLASSAYPRALAHWRDIAEMVFG